MIHRSNLINKWNGTRKSPAYIYCIYLSLLDDNNVCYFVKFYIHCNLDGIYTRVLLQSLQARMQDLASDSSSHVSYKLLKRKVLYILKKKPTGIWSSDLFDPADLFPEGMYHKRPQLFAVIPPIACELFESLLPYLAMTSLVRASRGGGLGTRDRLHVGGES